MCLVVQFKHNCSQPCLLLPFIHWCRRMHIRSGHPAYAHAAVIVLMQV